MTLHGQSVSGHDRPMTAEYAVVNDTTDRLTPSRFATAEQAVSEVARLEALRDEYRVELEEWERENPAEGLHPSGTNEPWWRWHKQGWKDARWSVVKRQVTAWERLDA